jgi:hypothetical protein
MNESEDPRDVGMWEPITARFHHLPVHLALLHTGKVLGFGGSGNDPRNEGRPFRAEIWDPLAGGDGRPIDQDLSADTFCSGHAFLPDGRLLVAGGTRLYDRLRFGFGFPPFRGTDHAYAFDPVTETWTRLPNMSRGRWYPTLVPLPDGGVLATSGLSKHFPWFFRRSIEFFASATGWHKERAASRWLPLYPRLHLVPRGGGKPGGVFYSGSFNTHYTYPFRLKSFPTALLDLGTSSWRKLGPPRHAQREEGASILLPLVPPDYRPVVMLLGGGNFHGAEVIPQVELIDLGEEQPAWTEIPAQMMHPRYYAYSVILPDRGVLVVGGRMGKGDHRHGPPAAMSQREHEASDRPPQDPQAIHEAELFDPDTQTWRLLAPMRRDRLYHANALLLPDGRVMAAGSNPSRGSNELSIELYRPPYLFRGERPVIEEVTNSIHYGQTFEMRTPDASDITEVALIRPSATTHCVNPEQRYVGLQFRAVDGSALRIEAPPDAWLAPPGYYMAFVLRDGIPSEARFVRLSR